MIMARSHVSTSTRAQRTAPIGRRLTTTGGWMKRATRIPQTPYVFVAGLAGLPGPRQVV